MCMLFSNANRVQAVYGTYGYKRGAGLIHNGIDVDTLPGMDKTVYSTVSGAVRWARCVARGAPGWGNTHQWGWFVWVVDGRGFAHIFAHLAGGSLRVQEGQRVTAGQALGTMGKTGNAAGDAQGEHVHYEVREGSGRPVDPTPWCKIPNRVGTTQGGTRSGRNRMWCLDITAGGRLEAFTAPDVHKIRPGGKLPAGKAILLEDDVPLAGYTGLGAKVRLPSGDTVWLAKDLGHCEVVQNRTEEVLDRFFRG